MNSEQLLKEADRCVKCGLCLPHCPTYRLTRDEGDSPRGRVSLIQALATGSLNSPRLHRHLDRCLGCLACESACPSGVKYGRLIDGTRARQPQHSTAAQRLSYALISRLPYLPGLRPALRFYQKSGIRRLLRVAGGPGLRRLDDLLPDLQPHPSGWQEVYPPRSGQRGRVGLFTGCVGRITDQPALLASIRVLTAVGLEVVVPRNQVCCGALHLHNGQPMGAARLAEANRRSFDPQGLETVVYVASGCGIQLNDYHSLGRGLQARVVDICSYLLHGDLLGPEDFFPMRGSVQLHIPCSVRHPSGKPDPALELLGMIPELECRPLPDTGCCGAAGSYLLKEPEMADNLRKGTLDAVRERGSGLLFTSNTGCALHLRAGLLKHGLSVQVGHPIELVERQLKDRNTRILPRATPSTRM